MFVYIWEKGVFFLISSKTHGGTQEERVTKKKVLCNAVVITKGRLAIDSSTSKSSHLGFLRMKKRT